jgi:hypothetical protein
MGYGLDGRGYRNRFPVWAGNFYLHHRALNVSGAHPGFHTMSTGVFSLGVKRSGHEADHSPSSSAEIKEWVELYLHSPMCLNGVVLG